MRVCVCVCVCDDYSLGLLVRPMLQLVQWQAGLVWDSLVLPLLSALYRVALERSRPVVDFLVDKVGWPLVKKIAPHLQQKELLKKLAYPFVTGFSHFQTYPPATLITTRPPP